MKELKNVNVKELKEVVKELNDSGLIDKKIKLVGISNQKLLDEFTTALADLDEDADVPQGIADFYNDLYADEIVEETGSEDEDGDEITEEESEDLDEEDETESEEVLDDDESSDEDKPSSVSDSDEPKKPVVKTKKEKKPVVVRDKTEKKKLGIEKRAEINTKLSLTKKVTNLLNFADQRYKKTTYFPLDVETVRVLEGNVGLYPSEILAAIKHDKKAAKKTEGFTAVVLIREINKIKSAYSYIVGAIREDRAGGKFRNIMTTLLAGKDVPPEMAHYSTVKVARRALLAYMEVTGIDYSTMQTARKELTKKASEKNVTPEPKVGIEKKETPTPKVASKKSSKKK